jgi:rhodanese-related sulfurtransferase
VHILRENGFNAYVIHGGFKAWTDIQGEVEMVPEDDVVVLPSFS